LRRAGKAAKPPVELEEIMERLENTSRQRAPNAG
jgi:hypothetical protein